MYAINAPNATAVKTIPLHPSNHFPTTERLSDFSGLTLSQYRRTITLLKGLRLMILT